MSSEKVFKPSEPTDMQSPKSSSTVLTNSAGNPVANNQNSVTAGPRGPVLLQDHHLLERMAVFNRERVPERVVHAKGSGAFGTFTVTADITKYTNAAMFSEVGKQCRMLARFSTVAGEHGFADTVRDPRGFSLKFYTEEGNWDMVGNNTPVFFVRDGIKFQDFIHSQKRHPVTDRRSETMMFDFWSLSPESMHQVVYMFGDRGIPRSYRHMNGYSSHTYSLWNDAGERYYVKWHFHTQQGVQNLTEDEATEIAGKNPDFHRQDLFSAIENGDYPKWKVSIQVMPEADAETYHIHPFDLTKTWPHADYPLMEVGEFELNENPTNFFAQIEQSAFEPSNAPRGFGFSPDKMLQARLMSYADAHRYRIGVNYAALPVNHAVSPVHTYHKDGQTHFDLNQGGQPVYEPNSFGGPVQDDQRPAEPALRIDGNAARYDWPKTDEDYFAQPGELFRLLDEAEQGRMYDNFARHLGGAPDFIQQRYLGLLDKVDTKLGAGVRVSLKKPEFTAEPEIRTILTEKRTNAAGGTLRPQQEAVGADD